MARPSPVPFSALVVKYGSKMCGSTCGRDAGPLVEHRQGDERRFVGQRLAADHDVLRTVAQRSTGRGWGTTSAVTQTVWSLAVL